MLSNDGSAAQARPLPHLDPTGAGRLHPPAPSRQGLTSRARLRSSALHRHLVCPSPSCVLPSSWRTSTRSFLSHAGRRRRIQRALALPPDCPLQLIAVDDIGGIVARI